MAWLEPTLAAAAVFAADQTAKHVVLTWPRFAAPGPRAFLDLRCVINRRGALLSLTRPQRYVAFALCAAAALAALTQDMFAHNLLGATGIGLVLGGIVGNAADLFRRDGIVDFLVIGPLPVSNIADWAIAAGLALALWTLV